MRNALRVILIGVIGLALAGSPAAHASTRSSKCVVPDVVGTHVAWAKWELKRAQCGVQVVIPRSAGRVTTVASQSAAPGRLARHGFVVRIVLGEPPVCHPQHNASVVAHDVEMVLTARSPSEGRTVFEACVKRTAAWITVLALDSIADLAEEAAQQAQIAGTRVAFALVQNGKYGSSTDIITRDIAAADSTFLHISVSTTDALDVTGLALNRAGTVAWITRPRAIAQQSFEQLQVCVAGQVTTLDSGSSTLADLAIDGTSVRWTNNGVARSAPIP